MLHPNDGRDGDELTGIGVSVPEASEESTDRTLRFEPVERPFGEENSVSGHSITGATPVSSLVSTWMDVTPRGPFGDGGLDDHEIGVGVEGPADD